MRNLAHASVGDPKNYQTMVKLPIFNDTEYVMLQLLVKVMVS